MPSAPRALIWETMSGIVGIGERIVVALSKHELTCLCARDGVAKDRRVRRPIYISENLKK